MKTFAAFGVAALTLLARTDASAQYPAPPPPVVSVTPASPSPPPPPPPREDEKPTDSAVDLHLDAAWSMRHVDALTVRAPDFGVGIGGRGPNAAAFFVLRFMPGSTSEGLTVRNYEFDFLFQAIWGHFRLEFGIDGAFMTVDRITRDNTILGSFIKFDLGPRVDLLQLEPVTVYLRATGFLGGGDGFLSGVYLGGGIDFDLWKTHPNRPAPPPRDY